MKHNSKNMVGILGATVLTSALSLIPVVASAQTASADGELRKVDNAARRVVIRHGEWKGMNMQAMTMAFQVRDGVSLEGLKAADKVHFAVEREGREYVVTAIERKAASVTSEAHQHDHQHHEHEHRHAQQPQIQAQAGGR